MSREIEDLEPDDRAAVEEFQWFLEGAGHSDDRCECGGFDGRSHHPLLHDEERMRYARGD